MDAVAILDRMYTDGTVADPDGGAIDVSHDSVSREVGRQIVALLEKQALTRTLEIGMAWGGSALHICEAHRARGEGTHVAIDPIQSTMFKGIGRLNLERTGLDGLATIYEEFSYEALPRLLDEGRRFDLVFIDGSHLFDFVLVDFFYVDLLLETGGYVVFDDLWMPAIRRVVDFALANRAYELEPYPIPCEVPLVKRMARVAQRYKQTPLSGSGRVKRMPDNICFLKKTGSDDRKWFHYKRF